VTHHPNVNLNSLALIREELEATIQRAAGEFEVFLLDGANTEALENCRTDMAQIGGTLRMIQFPGAALLADEISAAATDIASAGGASAEALAGALSHAFFALPRYIELVATRQTGHPMLVIPYVNELRVARRQPLIPEYHFSGEPPLQPLTDTLPAPAVASRPQELARLQQMFQVGLLAILKQQNEALNLRLIARACQRFAALTEPQASNGFWWLAAAVTERLANGGLTLNLNRRRTLGAIERLMARYVRQGEQALSGNDTTLRMELQFLLALSTPRPGLAEQVAAAFGLSPGPVDDRELARQRELMRGPGTAAIDSIVKAVKEELRQAKEILEVGSLHQSLPAEELASLRDILERVADTLQVLNLNAASDILRNQLGRIEQWTAQSSDFSTEQFLAVADALLFIESSLLGLYRQSPDAENLGQVSENMRRLVIAESQLAEAMRIVIEESQAGLTLAKRAVTTYLESGFDPIHIGNVGTTLDTVRGAMQMLGQERPAGLLRGCVGFVESCSRSRDYTDQQRQQLVETLADALISLEYYLSELAAQRTPDERILNVAEESLGALGVRT
jgi:hypothetical protein